MKCARIFIHFLAGSSELGHLSIWEMHYLLAPILLDGGNRESGLKQRERSKQVALALI